MPADFAGRVKENGIKRLASFTAVGVRQWCKNDSGCSEALTKRETLQWAKMPLERAAVGVPVAAATA
eukprot:2665282-Amphidinium_carterae.1